MISEMKKGKRWLIMAMAILLFTPQNGIARLKPPSDEQRRYEEVSLRKALQPMLKKELKDQYITLLTQILYINQKQPIISKNVQTRQFKLPGFDTSITLSNKEKGVSGFVDNYQRYRTLTLIINRPLDPIEEKNIYRLLEEVGDYKPGDQDHFRIVTLENLKTGKPIVQEKKEPVEEELAEVEEMPKERSEEEEKADSLLKDIQNEEQERQNRLSKLFPDVGEQRRKVTPIQEVESSRHLILSREAFFNNDLDLALNEVIEAININPYSPKGYEMLGSIYYRLKWHTLALENWSKALALNPSNKKLNKYIEKVKSEL